MKMRILMGLCWAVSLSVGAQNQREVVTFTTADGIEVTADEYGANASKPFMVLFHQAGYSRGEYTESAKMLSKFNYNCLAIDQRSGNAVNNVVNQTAQLAQEKSLPTNYADAYADMEAALNYAFEKSGQPVAVVGSSYSAALVFKLANEHPSKVSRVLAYSPGEYIQGESVATWVNAVTVPVFVTSSKAEATDVAQLISGNTLGNITHFIPQQDGAHGSKALWRSNPNNQEYWVATRMFLGKK